MSVDEDDSSPTPSEVLRYFLVWLRGFHRDRERSKAADWAMVGLTALGLIAAGISAVFLYRQLKEAQRSTDAAIRNFRIDERAWVELEPKMSTSSVRIEPTFEALIPDVKGPMQFKSGERRTEIVSYNIYLRNVGKTVAKHVVMRAAIHRADSDKRVQAKEVEEWANETQSSPRFSLSVLPPNAAVQAPSMEKVPGPPILAYGKEVEHPISHTYFVGRVDYQDEFGIPHWLTFCFVPTESSGELRLCDFGNEEDENSETTHGRE